MGAIPITLTLNLPPDVEAQLVAEADRRGLAVEDIVVPLVQGFLWSDDLALIHSWHQQEAERSAGILKFWGSQRRLREQLVGAITHENFCKWQLDAA